MKKEFVLFMVFLALLALMVAGVFIGNGKVTALSELDEPVIIYKTATSTEYKARIEELKRELVERLAFECESKGAQEPEALITFDRNGKASIGSLQFQVATVQHYAALLEDKELNRKQAIDLAMNNPRAFALAERIIFDEIGGIWNWENCAKKLNLAPEIVIIRKLSK